MTFDEKVLEAAKDESSRFGYGTIVPSLDVRNQLDDERVSSHFQGFLEGAAFAKKEFEAQLAEKDAEIAKFKYVPGRFKCPKCGFVVISQTLYMKSGNIGANNKPQQCSNNCGPMWRVAWKDDAIELSKAHRLLWEENTRLQGLVETLSKLIPNCEVCDKPGRMKFDSQGEGYFWLCSRNGEDHGEDIYCGVLVCDITEALSKLEQKEE